MKSKKKILLVEDERAVCELMRHVLEGHGYKFESAFNGIEALQKIDNISPDLVIMDINMPQMDGWQALTALKSSPKTSQIPVIMCTEENSFADIEKANDLGCESYITKPITAERVLKKIKEALG
ncbi:MAG: response regulator [Elusimicrobiota bacterium]